MTKRIFLLLFIVCLTLTGCSSISRVLEKQMLKQAGITEDENYKTYQSYNTAGKLTQQGYYSEEVFEAEENAVTQPPDTALISFAKNSYLNIKYYSDSDCTKEITDQAGYFKSGDKIYATVKLSKNVTSSMYIFEGFRLYQYIDGERELIDTVQPDKNGLLLKIDKKHIGMDFTIEPIGDYVSRHISLRDYYSDDDGNEHNLAGTWLIDDKEYTGEEVKINPVASYIISYEYDNDEFFYLSSSPECYYSNHEDGIIIFELMEPTDESYDYSVQLHKYLSADIETSINRTIKLNEADEQKVASGQKYSFKKLKYGDELKVVTDTAWPQLEMCRDLIVTSSFENKDGNYEYTLIVPQKGGEFVFNPDEYSYEHGTIVFKCFGEVVTNTQYLAKGTTISYSAETVDDGYWLPENNRSIIVGDEEETKAALNSIHFIPETKVTVYLPQPSYGGKIRYFVDGKEIKTSTYQTTSGVDIVMEFEPWDGWINNYINGETYRVTDSFSQTVRIGTKHVNLAFKEDPEHKPALEVVLDKSVGKNMDFSISASGLPTVESNYEGKWIDNSMVVVEPTRIGTETGIVLTMGNRSLHAGTALKVLVELQDTEGNKTSYYRLTNNMAEKQEPFMIYPENELGTSEIWYKTVKMTISVVDVLTFSKPTNPAHATVTVRSTDTQENLEDGCLIEPSTDVTVTISPLADYYVTGKNVKNDIYQDKMKFSQYQRDIGKIIDEHPVEKYVHITLDTNDVYGDIVYTLGKDNKSGSIRVKAGTEITIEYKVTSEGYVVDGGSDGILGMGNKDKKAKKSITITSDMDGSMITRTSFGINVVKYEEE